MNDFFRHYTRLDQLLMNGFPVVRSSQPPAPYPAADVAEVPLDAGDRRHAAGLMRVNHAGEIAAQALYRGQAAVARSPRIRRQMLEAAGEEQAHLAWCARRLAELDDRPSRLAALWYAGSFAIGAVAGLAGDAASLGFVEETERQVAAHLEGHKRELPAGDARSRAVVNTMQRDEIRHGANAAAAGARPLPASLRKLMSAVAGVMKFGAYRF
ncbi:MAG: 2-polyprenyl-3-methyl-6-methoxy-1,4-benzoquinone monooxygenase [Nevskiaceae bacterium]|nr:MAG: 2-polyprenyl-3-methyl-6-methoxy-1,4-benzoquinone monooxygenase [Nevskiaceae bacterium]TBR71991.1 MAG: 2-polyprenyl-3-methyl-6-methoxy-1,4-benzoquinone monooxygenase [Nevskiaceae bacterium]